MFFVNEGREYKAISNADGIVLFNDLSLVDNSLRRCVMRVRQSVRSTHNVDYVE